MRHVFVSNQIEEFKECSLSKQGVGSQVLNRYSLNIARSFGPMNADKLLDGMLRRTAVGTDTMEAHVVLEGCSLTLRFCLDLC